MDKKPKYHFSQKLTERSLAALLIFSFICTVLGFGIAYNEHCSLSILSDKYQQAIEKIDACEESISELSQKIDSLQTQVHTENPSHSEEAVSPGKEETADTSPTINSPQTNSEPNTTVASQISDSKYYVTQSGTKYHIASCSYLSKSRIPVSLETIKSKSYSPCSRCIK